jgi:aspartyl-tRNA(Asn)/glutamyl-tRNA(Gln) amidotransferase subunit A
MEAMDADVAERYEFSLQHLEAAGVTLVPISWPTEEEQQDIKAIFAGMVPAELLATLGREWFQKHRHEIDPVAVRRLEAAWDLPVLEYIRLTRLQGRLAALVHDRMQGLDGIVGPTTPLTARPISELSDVSAASAFVARSLSYTRAANVYDMCAITIPISDAARGLPVGLQIMCRAKEETRLLSLANAISHVISTQSD